jgi:hypothetical protein
MHWYHSVLVEDKVERSFWNEHRNNRGAKAGPPKDNQTNKKTWSTREPKQKKNNPKTSGYIVSYQPSATIEYHSR